MQRDTAANFIRSSFEPSDRLAVVLINKQSGSVVQRLATADQAVSPEFQSWLRFQNAQNANVYCTLNTLRADARGRTKEDIDMVRHIYLDFDFNAEAAVKNLREYAGMPQVGHLVNTSPGKWQVSWRVTDFNKVQAEELQRGMARHFGADPASTDCSRVMRLPGFYNRKYTPASYVRVTEVSKEVYTPEQFPRFEVDERSLHSRKTTESSRRSLGTDHFSQSERDWAYARRSLARGDPPELVARKIAVYRQGEKSDVEDYAERTVRKALASLQNPVSSTPER